MKRLALITIAASAIIFTGCNTPGPATSPAESACNSINRGAMRDTCLAQVADRLLPAKPCA